MTYEKAIYVIENYMKWRDSEKVKMPSYNDVTEALKLSVSTMQKVSTGELPSSSEQLRFDSLQETIQQFINDNKKYK